jgi:hypothetical protein
MARPWMLRGAAESSSKWSCSKPSTSCEFLRGGRNRPQQSCRRFDAIYNRPILLAPRILMRMKGDNVHH